MKSKTRYSIFRILKYVKPYWAKYFFATLAGLYKFTSPVAIVWVFGQAIDVLSAARAGEIAVDAAWQRTMHLFITGVGIAILNPLPVYIRSILGADAAQKVIRDIRCDLYAHVQKLSHTFYDANRSGSLTSRIISDVQALQPFLNKTLIQFWMNIGLITVILFYFFSRNVILGLLSISLIPLQLIVLRTIGQKVKEVARQIRNKLAWLSGQTQEKLAAATIVKTFTNERDEIQRFTDDSETLVTMGIQNARLGGINSIFVTTLNGLAPLLVILIGGRLGLFHPETMSIGLLVQFVMMQNHLYGPFERLSETQIITANALGAMDRIFDIFDTEPDISNKPGAKQAHRFKGEIIFNRVSFTYPAVNGKKIIEDLALTIPARSSIALVGPSGGGKSTVARLLNRFYEVDSGKILIDRTNISDYTIKSLRGQIGLVPQEAILFSGTVLENILYGRPEATVAEAYEAARKAYALDFILALDDGFETQIGERGAKLSGGQKQRIAIARAFLKNPSILVLDEATSALDSESERIIQEAIMALMQDRTTLMIAHRLSTIMNADQIAVIDNGRLVELGSHQTLIEKNGMYTRLCNQQFIHSTSPLVVENVSLT
ncbi:ABC transporter ATP-binding protein [candidate division KSB1 bacterium]|nr:ABC transporter ATP-binding protein [candidate division KSB1 bacterium]